MVAYLRGRCPGRIVSSFAIILLLGFSNPTPADEFFPSNLWPQSFTTLQAAEDAMRAVPGYDKLEFDHLLDPGSGVWTYRVYTVPPVTPNPPKWSTYGMCTVPSIYDSGQAVCDAIRAQNQWPNPLIYIPDPPNPNIYEQGTCRDGGTVLGYPGYWLTCPTSYHLTNTTYSFPCGTTTFGWGPNATCKNYTTARIDVRSTQSVHCGIGLSGFPAEVEPGKKLENLQAQVTCVGKSPEGIAVTITSDVEDNSGGHKHIPGRRPAHAGTVSGGNVTDANGVVPFSFTAPAPAGDHTVTAKCVDGSCGEAVGSVWVGIKGLVSLYDTHLYKLVGSDDVHPNNHYLTNAASGSMVWLAELYRTRFPSDPVLHLNDASLERGGLFDIKYTARTQWWSPPHEEHRKGTVIDVRANDAPGAVPSRNHQVFTQLARRAGADASLHSPGTYNQHFHVRLMGAAE